ncbi:calcium/calmodulin dependent protein kinase, putative [Aspergillus udagawae]|uniref:Calcium/calmodulin dependent protein kinase, putative n=1 Tax=Aspergillus udagawae TaxID=91492 RepID=A0A8H3P0S9_9EURO|nr:calcium/calmodulin dependent protein kinase, putative [Aspergillus udagawae]
MLLNFLNVDVSKVCLLAMTVGEALRGTSKMKLISRQTYFHLGSGSSASALFLGVSSSVLTMISNTVKLKKHCLLLFAFYWEFDCFLKHLVNEGTSQHVLRMLLNGTAEEHICIQLSSESAAVVDLACRGLIQRHTNSDPTKWVVDCHELERPSLKTSW